MDYLGWQPAMSYDNTVVVMRGDRATPQTPLCAIAHVGGMNTSPDCFADFTFTKKALKLLSTDPVEGRYTEQPLTLARDSGRWAEHLCELVRIKVLSRADPSQLYIFGTYNAVYKDDNEARSIFDMRKANSLLNADEVNFSLMSGDVLAEQLLGIDYTSNKFRFLHCDVKNCYYQMPIGPSLQRRCALRMGLTALTWNVLPMGYKKACGICQGIVWGVIAYRLDGEDSLGFPNISSSDEAPSHVTLEGGGFIVLTYDSVLVCDLAHRIQQWESRLIRNFEKANLKLKYITTESRICNFTFAGIRCEGNKLGLWIKPDPVKLEKWQVKLRTASILSTPRSLFRLLGVLRFISGIQGIQRSSLGRLTKYQSMLGTIDSWDADTVDPSVIGDSIKRILTFPLIGRHRKSHLEVLKKSHKTCYVAVDATTTRLAAWVYNEDTGAFDNRIEYDFETPLRIDRAESIALLEGIRSGHSYANVIFVANDNTAVGRSFWRGYSRSEEIDEVIVQGAAYLTSAQHIVVIADVPSEENIADIGTRPNQPHTEQEFAFRKQRTLERLKRAEEVWRSRGWLYIDRHYPRTQVESLESNLDPPEDEVIS